MQFRDDFEERDKEYLRQRAIFQAKDNALEAERKTLRAQELRIDNGRLYIKEYLEYLWGYSDKPPSSPNLRDIPRAFAGSHDAGEGLDTYPAEFVTKQVSIYYLATWISPQVS